jgi:cytochrome c oxidase subunit IV
MKDKGHEFAKLFMIVGMFFAIAFCVTFIYIVWIGQPI